MSQSLKVTAVPSDDKIIGSLIQLKVPPSLSEAVRSILKSFNESSREEVLTLIRSSTSDGAWSADITPEEMTARDEAFYSILWACWADSVRQILKKDENKKIFGSYFKKMHESFTIVRGSVPLAAQLYHFLATHPDQVPLLMDSPADDFSPLNSVFGNRALQSIRLARNVVDILYLGKESVPALVLEGCIKAVKDIEILPSNFFRKVDWREWKEISTLYQKAFPEAELFSAKLFFKLIFIERDGETSRKSKKPNVPSVQCRERLIYLRRGGPSGWPAARAGPSSGTSVLGQGMVGGAHPTVKEASIVEATSPLEALRYHLDALKRLNEQWEAKLKESTTNNCALQASIDEIWAEMVTHIEKGINLIDGEKSLLGFLLVLARHHNFLYPSVKGLLEKQESLQLQFRNFLPLLKEPKGNYVKQVVWKQKVVNSVFRLELAPHDLLEQLYSEARFILRLRVYFDRHPWISNHFLLYLSKAPKDKYNDAVLRIARYINYLKARNQQEDHLSVSLTINHFYNTDIPGVVSPSISLRELAIFIRPVEAGEAFAKDPNLTLLRIKQLLEEESNVKKFINTRIDLRRFSLALAYELRAKAVRSGEVDAGQSYSSVSDELLSLKRKCNRFSSDLIDDLRKIAACLENPQATNDLMSTSYNLPEQDRDSPLRDVVRLIIEQLNQGNLTNRLNFAVDGIRLAILDSVGTRR